LLEQKFPGGRTMPRNAIILGRHEYQRYKNELGGTVDIVALEEKIKAEFKLQWQDEYKKIQRKITKIPLLSAPELIRMLEEALSALKVQEIKPKLLNGKFASYSLSYQQPSKGQRVGIVWTEDASMTSFYSVMNACQKVVNPKVVNPKVVNPNLYQNLYLIREAGVGNAKLAGNRIYRQIFTGSLHHHIKPTLSSVHYLATYHSLVNSVLANELVVAGKTLSLQELEALIRQTDILRDCILLQDLGIVYKKNSRGDGNGNGSDNGNGRKLPEVKQFLLNVVITQHFLGRQTLIQNASSKFPDVVESQIDELIEQLCQESQIQILDPSADPKAQLVCLVPKAS
jgi:hypothetical protein